MKLSEIKNNLPFEAVAVKPQTINIDSDKRQFELPTQEEHLEAVNHLVDLLAKEVLNAHLDGIEFKLAIENAVHMIQADIKQKLLDRIRVLIISKLGK